MLDALRINFLDCSLYNEKPGHLNNNLFYYITEQNLLYIT